MAKKNDTLPYAIMLWGCVASTCTGNLDEVEGQMNSSHYQ